ncbi:hypothetical protein [uncultured Methylobacterium sp.]|uniref:hypothetical protein n=1 Tax=uncultured Methylobacterium sp. TaxID=157278 RepID=UPI0035CBCC33
MHKVTPTGKVTRVSRIALAAVVALTLAAMPSAAEARARGFRLRFGVGGAEARTPAPVPAPLPSRPPERMAAAGVAIAFAPITVPQAGPAAARLSDPRVPGAGNVEPVVGPLTGASALAKPAAQPVRVAGPWCPPDRIVGAGVGFCAVN